MNAEQIANLPDELKDRYRKMESTFNSPGWALIEEWAKTRHAETQSRQLRAGTWDHALVNRGAGFAYRELENLREATEHEFAAVAAANAEVIVMQDEIDFE